jgi:type I restriction enzyme S subunit
VAVTGVEVTINQDLKALTPDKWVEASFVAWALRAFGSDILKRCKKDGTTVASIDSEALRRYQVPLAPQKEQRRVVEAIDSYLTRLNHAVASLERVQAKLKAYRASVLKAAVEGRLVPTEASLARAEKRAYESAEALLARILKERRHRWEETELARLQAAGKTPKNDKWKAKYSEPVAPEASTMPHLPEGWCWATVEQLAHLVTDGDHNPPRRVSKGVPHLTAKHIKKWRILFEDCSFVSPEGFEQTRSRYEPCEGDVIVTCVGTVGETALVPAGSVFSADRNLAAIRLVSGGVFPAFVMYLLSSPVFRQRVMTSSGATAQPHLYLGDLRTLPVPIPPRPEQEKVIAEIERLLTLVDASEAVVVTDVKRSSRLRQAVLRWAFEGKLVNQDPEDEPAEKLLARIRAERAAVAPAKKDGGRKAKGAA